ncbi:protein TRACHEARY ELEMENT DIFFERENTIATION-RELATED 7A-like [Arachis duranensis]|uniref:Protein TRACHEARY ELEMENT DIFFERENTIATION-RELATED 7A-like n=1 Tax=Arachis duranensis TaxID=130453 RepID=A0A6P4B5R8_ARADU|nr:protein TRACHEARY ELEMENT DIFFERENTIATION-RELATED 7A-like [Arachis duranensis]
MASSQPNIHFNFPQFHPPPPSHPFNYPPPPPPPPPSHCFTPPPPHAHPPPSPHHPVLPPPYPVPTPPSPDNHHPTIIVIVFVSFGGLLFLSVLAFALFCLIKKMKKKKQETDIIHFDEHRHVTEAIVPGPCGEQVVVLSVDDDVHIDEEIIKNEEFGHAMQEKQSSTANEGNDPRSPDHDHQQKA